ncbi:MAG: hypothetical protein JSR24_13420 [Proteobacteria bacterium]|nr:hypothetical protein [Pseudomonadota bacterium]
MPRHWLSCLMLALCALAAPAAHAVDITVDEGPPAGVRGQRVGPSVPTLRLTGMIEPGDADKLESVLARIAGQGPAKSDRPLTTIEMNSMGGSLPDGFQIGLTLRKHRMIAVVRRQGLCVSSCALAFLGGNMRSTSPAAPYPDECNIEIGGKVAFHNFFLNSNGLRQATSSDPVQSRLQGFTDARGGAASLVKYAGEMGLQPNFVASLMGRPVDEFQYIETVGQFLSFHVCPIGLQRPSIPIEQQAKNVCFNSLGLTQAVQKLVVTPMTEAQAKLYLLERLQENMQASKAKGRLAAQLSNGAVMRVKDEIDKLYEDLQAAGVALPDIVGPTFEIGSRQSGVYEPMCYVSLSPTEPDKFDVAVQGPRGMTEPQRQPPGNARRLFLFDRNDVINPRPK